MLALRRNYATFEAESPAARRASGWVSGTCGEHEFRGRALEPARVEAPLADLQAGSNELASRGGGHRATGGRGPRYRLPATGCGSVTRLRPPT